jgi:hypothetical protein
MSLSHESEYERKGYTIVNDVFNEAGIQQIIQIIDSANQNSDLFRKTKQLFAIRQFLKEIPRLQPLNSSNKVPAVVWPWCTFRVILYRELRLAFYTNSFN